MSDEFDVFLSHNGRDKPAVRELAAALRKRTLRVWLDEHMLRPGIPWQKLLEDGILASASIAVLIGKDGLGPWEDEEMQAALRLAAKDKRPVIPVILPDGPQPPNLPMFLNNRTWVDLRPALSEVGLDKLEWGITGVNPNKSHEGAEDGLHPSSADRIEGSRTMSCDWLRGPREAAGFTQEALARALGLNVKTIQRLERCGADTPRQVRYADLAEQLKVCPIQLAEHHARDLDANGQAAHAQRARDAADRLRRARHFPSIDPRPIQSALAACRATGLVARIAERAPDLPDEQAQAGRIVRLLDDARLDAYANLVDIPLEETIARASTDDHLVILARFLRAIIRVCAAADEGLVPGRWHQHHGESKAWPFRAMIDRSLQRDGMRQVRAAPNTAEARLDDGSNSTGAVRSGKVTQLSVDARLHQLVCEIADTLGTVDKDRPAVGDTQAFAEFCKTVNNELFRHNSRHSYVFGLWDKYTCEAEEVRQGLLRRLSNLYLFDSGDSERTSTLLRAKSEELETWYAAHLRAIAERRSSLTTTPTHSTPSARSTTKPEPTPMPKSHDAPIQIVNNLNIHNGDGPTSQAAGEARAHQHDLSTPRDELLPLLDRLLAETNTGAPHYTHLRKACRDAQGVLEETATLSEPTKTLLQRAIEALPATDKAFGVATKLAALIAKIPGLGA